MKKHFFERILAIIITFVVVILFWCILVLCFVHGIIGWRLYSSLFCLFYSDYGYFRTNFGFNNSVCQKRKR